MLYAIQSKSRRLGTGLIPVSTYKVLFVGTIQALIMACNNNNKGKGRELRCLLNANAETVEKLLKK